MPNTVEIVDKKMNILQACIKVFSQKGYHKATIEDIAHEAGIGKGTVYLYFSSKKELFEEMVRYSLDQYYSGIKTVLSNYVSIRERLMYLSKFHENYFMEYIDLAQAMIGQSIPKSLDQIRVMAKKEKLKLRMLFLELIEDGIEKGEVRNDINKEIAMTSIMATINQYYIDKITVNKTYSSDKETIQLVDFLIRAIS